MTKKKPYKRIPCKYCGEPVDKTGLRVCSHCTRLRRAANGKRYRDRLSFAQRKLVQIKGRASRTGLDLDLELSDLENLGACYYCGQESTGLDRVDSGKGYLKSNTVPACQTCNSMKWSLPMDEFVAQCKRIAETHS